MLLIPQPAGAHAPAPHPGRPGTSSARRRPDSGAVPPALPASRAVAPALPVSRADRTAIPGGPEPGAVPPAAAAPSRGAHPPQVAVRLPSGALIGIAVAVMVAAALTLAAVQRRRRYRPRPGPPSTLAPETPPLPEVISALRRAARRRPPPGQAGDQDAALVTARTAKT